MKKFTIGDIHGQFDALREVLKLSKFNYSKDRLIVLGDIVDGGINTNAVVEELLKIKNLIFCLGNHDKFFLNHISSGWAEKIWVNQGGSETIKSYGGKAIPGDYLEDKPKLIDTSGINVPVTHQEFFNKAKYYHIEDNMLFVHGGINPAIPFINSQSKHDLLWDRNLIEYCRMGRPVPLYSKVFVGHTSTQAYNSLKPLKFKNLWCLDTGAGWDGKLTIMNIETEEYWQSKQQNPVRTPVLNDISYKEFLERTGV